MQGWSKGCLQQCCWSHHDRSPGAQAQGLLELEHKVSCLNGCSSIVGNLDGKLSGYCKAPCNKALAQPQAKQSFCHLPSTRHSSCPADQHALRQAQKAHSPRLTWFRSPAALN